MIQPVGYFKLWRELYTKPIWLNSTAEQKVVLMTVMAMANFRPNKWEWQGKQFELKEGQFITSLDSLVKECGSGVTIRKVRTALKRFEILEFLTNESTKTGRLITVGNWELYQGSGVDGDKALDKEVTKTRQRGDKQVTPKEEGKEGKKVKKNIYAEFVTMNDEEYQKLLLEFEEVGTKERIEKLNLYKGSTGKKYSSDYLTILSWERKNNPSGGKPKKVKVEEKIIRRDDY